MFDLVDKIQLETFAFFTNLQVLHLEAVFGGTAEQTAVQRYQLQLHSGFHAQQRLLGLGIGFGDGGFEHAGQLLAGVPGTRGACRCHYHCEAEYACRFLHELFRFHL
ncbi:hypothetical protein D3C75_1101290 [compost metagenome]